MRGKGCLGALKGFTGSFRVGIRFMGPSMSREITTSSILPTSSTAEHFFSSESSCHHCPLQTLVCALILSYYLIPPQGTSRLYPHGYLYPWEQVPMTSKVISVSVVASVGMSICTYGYEYLGYCKYLWILMRSR